jgi:isopentenyl diphosphate isomerase/L-lactate dehydrogenase-like FMN-dependent dehydrogenase
MDPALQRRGYSVRALRDMARQRLPRMVFDMVDGAAGDEVTMRRNEAALAEIAFTPKFLDGAPRRNQSVELLGLKLPSPVIIGPTGLAGLLWPNAELAAARAAGKFGTVYTTSHASTATIEEIGAASTGPKWMQVFLFKDRGITVEFADRARDAGYAGLVLTVDNQVTAGRDRDLRNGMTFPLRLAPGNMLDLLSHPGWLLRMRATPRPTAVNYGARIVGIGGFGRLMGEELDPAVGWADFDWLRSRWRGPMLVKGLLHPGEAQEARARGADAVIVSNHGGRQLDGALSSIEALPAIVEAIGDNMPVLVDGGFRRGVDVVKALALGARAVLIGRPHLWGVACAGEEGVAWVLELFRREIDRALALGGWDGIAKLDRSAVRAPPPFSLGAYS